MYNINEIAGFLMFGFIIIGFIFSIYMIISYVWGRYKGFECFIQSLVYLILSPIIGCFSGMALTMVLILGVVITTDSVEVENHYLYIDSLDVDKNIHGGFVLGSGEVNSINSYSFYYNAKYGKTIGSLPTYDSYIKQTNNRRPEIISVDKIYKSKYFTYDADVVAYVFYVPKNTIKRNFNVN